MNSLTSAMTKEAATAGFYHSDLYNKDYPKIQILTIEELLDGATVDMPPLLTTFKLAAKVEGKPGAVQSSLGLDE